MSKRTGVKSGDIENGDQGFLSRWSARKAEIARAERSVMMILMSRMKLMQPELTKKVMKKRL